MRCSQIGCLVSAMYRYTWPGKDEAYICDQHVGKLRAVAAAMGMHLQIIELGDAS